jgi:hypothetical protein
VRRSTSEYAHLSSGVVALNDRQLVALLDAAASGVSCDGLRVSHDETGYTFATPEHVHEGLDEAAVRAVAAEHPWYVSNWFVWQAIESAPNRAFLRWLEDADERSVPERYEALAEGLTRTWGQLAVTTELGPDGERRYHLRHEADRGTPLDDLDVHTDPYDARTLVKHDAKDRYRPLKTAPSLVDGWAFAALDGRDLARAVDLVYPATIANWHREREGDLDVSHYRETAERQTGIYDVIDELPVEAVEWVAEACCVDSQCLKRREWDEDADTPLSVPRGDGEFPCREPCSLVVAAARKWTTLEQEEPREYTFELTPSEKEQLEALVGAVADGRIDDIREADVYEGANRYRTRYLRAKRMDEEGNLGGVPTE